MSEQPISVVLAVARDGHKADTTQEYPAHEARELIAKGWARPADTKPATGKKEG